MLLDKGLHLLYMRELVYEINERFMLLDCIDAFVLIEIHYVYPTPVYC